MKTKYYILSFILIGFFSCKNQNEYRDILYFNGTEETSAVIFTIDEPSSKGISVRASGKVTENVTVNLKIDMNLLEDYNRQTGKKYKPLPEGCYALSNSKATIQTGKYVSDPVMLEINAVDQFKEEDTYCVPITITGVEGSNLPVLESSKILYIIVYKPIITQAAILDGTYFTVDFKSDPGRDLTAVSQLTLEARVFVNAFQDSDPYISTIMGLEENFMLRFGDVKVPKDHLQLAGPYDISTPEAIPAGKWVHVAATYDGSKKCIYIDGKLNAYGPDPRGKIDLNGVDASRSFYIGRTSVDYGRYLNGYISEARIWTKALTQGEIASGICAVSPESPNLLAYWKFNSYKDENNQNIVTDLTGHGYDAKGNRTVSFVEGVKCP